MTDKKHPSFSEKLFSVLRKPLFSCSSSTTHPESSEPVPHPEQKAQPIRVPHSRGVMHKTGNEEDFEKILFVLSACERNSKRSFTEVLHVEKAEHGSLLVTTDAKRMHVSVIKTRIPPGEYKPRVSKETITLGPLITGVHYPDWKNVVPTGTVMQGIITPHDVSRGKAYLHELVKRLTGEQLNPDYLACLFQSNWAVSTQKERRKAVLFQEEGTSTYTVIMPLVS